MPDALAATPDWLAPPAATVATAPPIKPATMLVSCVLAYWSEKSSLRWSVELCSAMYGTLTTPIVCWPAANAAPKTQRSGRAVVDNRPMSATTAIDAPMRITRLRPIRSDSALMGKATTAETSADVVAMRPIVAVLWPRAAR